MQRKIQGYKFSEKELANESRSALVSAKALPKKKGDVTLYWQNYEEAALDKPIFYYMRGDKSMTASMGKPETFFVTFPGEEAEVPGEGGIKIPPKGE
tara:strand:+ start:172 stop:462 length:291 start_codon:yes stop_codon:yes gene_type:complete